MSYCRFSETCDVYVFPSVHGWLECCGCLLGDQWRFDSTEAMINHLQEHRRAGHDVPDIEQELRDEDEDNFPPQCRDGHLWGEPYAPYPENFPRLRRTECVRCGHLRADSVVL